ncbi:hypothetical protein ANN_10660 [Periplaneta americana]|uniref:Uncharacterized protein n=1 Tax=Periplaneta americana TaxID=6978 RepID=A0ABQ8T2W2_PERAM|nr:hypothetical protein ANN_10660 [Periplaneta americana]
MNFEMKEIIEIDFAVPKISELTIDRRSCIYSSQKGASTQGRVEHRRRGSGRRRVSTPKQNGDLVAEAIRNPHQSASVIRSNCHFPGSSRTFLRRLKDAGLFARIAAKKEYLKTVISYLVLRLRRKMPIATGIESYSQMRDEFKDEQEVVETYTSLVIDETLDLDVEDGHQDYGDIEDEPMMGRQKDGQKTEDAEETETLRRQNQRVFLRSLS